MLLKTAWPGSRGVKMNTKIQSLSMLLYFSVFALFLGCGRKESEDEPTEDAPQSIEEPKEAPIEATVPSVPAPTPPAPNPPTPVSIWVASNTTRAIAGYSYNSEGVVSSLGFIDLATYLPSGVATSLTFFNKNILLATIDPGTAGEKIIRIDFSGNSVSSVNLNWHQDATNLNNMSLFTLLKWSSSKLIALKSGTSGEGITYNMANNIATRIGATPFLATTTGACVIQTLQSGTMATSLAGVTKLLVGSSGAAPRLLLYDGIDSVRSCSNSFNFTTSLGLTVAHVPTAMTQMPNGKIYVRYQHTVSPIVASYEYDGTNLSVPTLVSADVSVLNNAVTDRGLVTLDSKNLLFANWANDSIYKLDIATGGADPLIRDMFTTDVNAIAIRPVD